MSSFLQAIRAESPECLKLSLGVRPTKAAPHHRRLASLSQQTIGHLITILLRDLKRGLLDLPALPDVAHRVRRLVEDDQTSVAQVVICLSLRSGTQCTPAARRKQCTVSWNSTDKTFIVSCP